MHNNYIPTWHTTRCSSITEVSVEAMEAYDEVDAELHSALILVLDANEWSDSCTGLFTPKEKVLGTQRTVRWVGRTSCPVAENRKIFPLPGIELRFLICSVRGLVTTATEHIRQASIIKTIRDTLFRAVTDTECDDRMKQ